MVENIVTTEETDELSDEIEVSPSHPYDLPGEWFVLNVKSLEKDIKLLKRN